MDAPAFERIEIDGRRGDQRLALAGAHFGDPALVEDDTADQLNVEMPQTKRAFGGLADGGEGLREDVVQLCAVGDLLAEILRPLSQGVVGKGLRDGFQRVDPLDNSLVGPDLPVVDGPEYLLGNPEHSEYPLPACANLKWSRYPLHI